MDNYHSILLTNAVHQVSTLPGIGEKTALRLVLNLLKRPEKEIDTFTESISRLKHEIKYCRKCHNISDTDICPICSSHKRDTSTVCVVENIQDVMSIENTGQYNGLYHVLGGIISPMDGIGPKDIEIDSLINRIEPEGISEVILALPTTMEGDTTTFYIYKRLTTAITQQQLKISQIARGIAIGNELGYTDEITLGRSIVNRTEYKAL